MFTDSSTGTAICACVAPLAVAPSDTISAHAFSTTRMKRSIWLFATPSEWERESWGARTSEAVC